MQRPFPSVPCLDGGQAGDPFVGAQEAEQRVGRRAHPVAPAALARDRSLGELEEFAVGPAEDRGEADVEIPVKPVEGGRVDPGPLEDILEPEIGVATLRAQVEQGLAQAALVF